MSTARDRRRAALQTLYQFDAGGYDPANEDDRRIIRQTLEHAAGGEAAHRAGFELADAAWATRDEADAAVTALAPDWPTHRQPVIDRSILRLAYHEIVAELAPPKVVINEAVELAREFSTEKSPLFINGVLDRIYKSRRDDDVEDPSPAATPAPAATPPSDEERAEG
ncbi:MAG: transcription antitermination factor NusB [Phycisphaerales bacterium]|nr:transcription antitermination factor NusB [Phycisphaerales bacterium]